MAETEKKARFRLICKDLVYAEKLKKDGRKKDDSEAHKTITVYENDKTKNMSLLDFYQLMKKKVSEI